MARETNKNLNISGDTRAGSCQYLLCDSCVRWSGTWVEAAGGTGSGDVDENKKQRPAAAGDQLKAKHGLNTKWSTRRKSGTLAMSLVPLLFIGAGCSTCILLTNTILRSADLKLQSGGKPARANENFSLFFHFNMRVWLVSALPPVYMTLQASSLCLFYFIIISVCLFRVNKNKIFSYVSGSQFMPSLNNNPWPAGTDSIRHLWLWAQKQAV